MPAALIATFPRRPKCVSTINVDAGVPMLEAMFRKRLRGYRAMGYSVDPQAKGTADQ